ncbi:MAG: fibrobacter succinogenes major paralogous domain-containing protein [FCB group bacterium]|jgi:uncharacterized protein (TIGR02145 family)
MKTRILLLLILVISFLYACGSDKTTNPTQDCYITIGTQKWMCKNLDVDHYRNGDPIPNVIDSLIWRNLTTGAWCYYNNDSALGAIYGKLYNWYAVYDPRGLAPEGWHVPSDSEWTILTNFLGGDSIAGGKLKEAGFSHWQSPNTGATDETGFSALPGGWQDEYHHGFGELKYLGCWWSSTDTTDWGSVAFFRAMICNDSQVYRSRTYYSPVVAYSVRCIKD